MISDDNPKDIHVDLPPGLIVDPNATPKCTQALFNDGNGGRDCPLSSVVGETTTTVINNGGELLDTEPVYNLVAPPGVPAEFGFQVETELPVRIDGSLRTGSDYGLTANVTNASSAADLGASSLTLWGVPADSSHDGARGGPAGAPLMPLLTMPTSCGGPLSFQISADSWQNPGNFVTDNVVTHDNNGNPIGVDGCNELDFSPTITVQPDTTVADSPAGLNVDLEAQEETEELAEANLKKAVVTLPEGMAISPSAANGLQGCSEAQMKLRHRTRAMP